MGKKKKPFIDKKTAHSFQLVHRSQRDPLQADEDSSKRVLLPLDSAAQGNQGTDKVDPPHDEGVEEQHQYGIYFDDDYDYMQHLKTRTDCTLEPLPGNVAVIENKKAAAANLKEFGSVKLPSEVFGSTYEEEEGLLNLAAPAPGPHPEWDPDVVAALDDDLDLNDEDNILDDDFIAKANAPCTTDDYGSDDDDLIRSDDDDDDDVEKYFPSDGEAEDDDGSGGFFFNEEETKSRFTNYSMTSSVIRRNKGLSLLDDQFEKVMEEYEDDEIGSLDHEEVVGTVDVGSKSHVLDAITEEFEQDRITKVRFADDEPMEKESNIQDKLNLDGEKSDDDKEDMITVTEKPKEQWDCESILSTYSNLYNHPTLIKEPPKAKTIQLSKRTGIPLGVLPERARPSRGGVGKDVVSEEMEIVTRTLTTGPKPRNEGKEEKRLRKKTVKEERRQRRTEKKSNKLAFKNEQKRQEASMANIKQQQGVKL